MHFSHKTKSILLLSILFCFIISGCQLLNRPQPTLGPPSVNVETPAPFDNSNPLPTFTPTQSVLGSNENPIVFGIVHQEESPEILDGFSQLNVQLSNSLQLNVDSRLFKDYLSLEIALQKNEVHFAWLMPTEYLLATQKDLVTSIIGVNNLGVSAYGIQYLAHRDSELTSYYDVGTNKATSSAEHALQQFAGMRPCLTNEKSLAGYWLPLAYLAQNNIPWETPVQTHSYTANIRSLYVKGVCGFSSTYAISADPRSSSAVIEDFPDAIEMLPIIWISPPIIPNRALAVSGLVEMPLQTRVSEFLLDYSRSESGKEILSAALNYEVSALIAQTDSAFMTLRELLSHTNINLLELVQ